jgi:hypothetical protein
MRRSAIVRLATTLNGFRTALRQSKSGVIIACFHTTFTAATENEPTTHSDGSDTMRKWLVFGSLCACLLPANALAWWDEGHMQIAGGGL